MELSLSKAARHSETRYAVSLPGAIPLVGHAHATMQLQLNVGHYLKRLIVINIQYSDPTFHVPRCNDDVFGRGSACRRATPSAASPATSTL